MGRASVLLACALLPAPTAAQVPWWRDTLGFTAAQLAPIRVERNGLPYLRVRIDTTEFWLLFDTGNMAGLTLATPQFDRLDLDVIGTVRRRDSSGEVIGEYRIGRAAQVEALGRRDTAVAIHEFTDPRLPGLFGPGDASGQRFTLDYRTRFLAVSDAPLELETGPGMHSLVRSARHPRLIVVAGEYRGERILIELDTGKTRTVVDPDWARRVGLAVGPGDTVVVGIVRLGEAEFDIRDAKPVGLGAIDPDLPAPLVLSLGSDTLRRFVLTVDYARGTVLLWNVR